VDAVDKVSVVDGNRALEIRERDNRPLRRARGGRRGGPALLEGGRRDAAKRGPDD